MRTRTWLVVLAAALALLVAACGGDDEEEAAGGGEVTVELTEQNGSGQTGTATLTEADGSTTVVVELSNAPDVPQPAHIHPGSCADLDPTPAYGLENLEGGSSESTVETTLEELQLGGYAINVHKSGEEADVYVACGDI